jgi:signal transduction histidine kinase
MKRLLVVLLPLLVVPLIVLSVLAWILAGQVEEQLMTTRRKQHGLLVRNFEQHFEAKLAELAGAFADWGRSALNSKDVQSPPDRGQSWCLLLNKDDEWVYPEGYAPASASETGLNILTNESLHGLMETIRAERLNLSAEYAAQKYESIYKQASTPAPVRARALLALGRTQRNMGQTDRSLETYQKAGEEFRNVNDETGVNFGAEALAARLRLLSSEGLEQEKNRCWSHYVHFLVDDNPDNRFPMPWGLALGHLRNALITQPQAKDESQHELYHKVQTKIEMLEAMGAALQNRPQIREAASRFFSFDDAVLLNQEIKGSSPGWFVASFKKSRLLEKIRSPLMRKLNDQRLGILSITDPRGKVLVGPRIEPAAQTGEYAMTRWGLPWTLQVGFSDFADFRAQARRRHLLLTGSIGALVILIALGVMLGGRMIRREMELSQLKTAFVDNVSHELRTPVTSIKLFSQMLSSGAVADADRRQEYFRLLVSESNRLTRMIENMLNFSRIVEGRFELKPRQIDVREFLEQLHEQLKIQVRSTGHDIRIHMADNLPVCSLDTEALSRAIANLVANSAKFSPDNREINITAMRRDHWLSISVRDYGVGIPETELPYIFERFYRAKNPGTDHVQGTGLGLTLVKDTIDRHGGTIHTKSTVGKGTLIELRIPIHEEEVA